MNLAVAIEAVLAQHILVGSAPGQTLAAVRLAGVKRRCVALLAKSWSAGGQQGLVNGSVGLVAKAAVFSYWLVLPQEWAALLLVTGKAVLVD